MEYNRLNEISKVAGTKASGALSKLINLPVTVNISPAVEIENSKAPYYMNPDEEVVEMTVKLAGEMTGMVLLIFKKKQALALCDFLLSKQAGDSQTFTAQEIEAMIEMSNILIGNFLGALAYPLKLKAAMHQVPSFKFDLFKNLSEHFSKNSSRNIHDDFFVEIVINFQQEDVKGYLIVMLGREEVKIILEK